MVVVSAVIAGTFWPNISLCLIDLVGFDVLVVVVFLEFLRIGKPLLTSFLKNEITGVPETEF